MFETLVAVQNQNGKVTSSAQYDLGDRVQVNSIVINHGIVTVDMLVQGPNDGMCCPTEKKVIKLMLQGDHFVDANTAPVAALSTVNRVAPEEMSPATKAAIAIYGHPLTKDEVEQRIKAGQESRLAITTEPLGAQVYIDGNLAGVTPLHGTLGRRGNSNRLIEIKKEGYKTVEKQYIPDGKDIDVSVLLELTNKW